MEGNRDDETTKVVYHYAISHIKFWLFILSLKKKKESFNSQILSLHFFKTSKIPSIVPGDGFQISEERNKFI